MSRITDQALAQWRTGTAAQRIAADIASRISGGMWERYQELPPTTTAPRTRPAVSRRCTSPPVQPGPESWLSDTTDFVASPLAVPVTRRRTRRLVRVWRLPELADDAESVVAELVTNAVEATGRARLDSPVRLTLIGSPLKTLLIAVWDATSAPPVAGAAGLADESGRGLFIVQALSDRWDWKKAPRGGKTVRALLRARRVTDRPAGTERQEHLRLVSGGE